MLAHTVLLNLCTAVSFLFFTAVCLPKNFRRLATVRAAAAAAAADSVDVLSLSLSCLVAC